MMITEVFMLYPVFLLGTVDGTINCPELLEHIRLQTIAVSLRKPVIVYVPVLPADEDSGPTCRTYVFQNESHTLGNALKCIINRYEDVEFCGYTVPHPAESKMHFRIQSRETPALDVLKRGLKDLEKVCDHTINLFEKEVQEFCKT